MHVLPIHSSKYPGALATGDSELLRGCRCRKCESPRVCLTESRVNRKLHAADRFLVLQVALARCEECHSRERVLPYDALPGKVTGAEVALRAVAEVLQGTPVESVAQFEGVCPLTIRLWMDGVGARFLDLFALLRHRAIVATKESPVASVLTSFESFSVEAARYRSVAEPRLSLAPQATEESRLAASAQALVDFVGRLGGVPAAALLGAQQFRQAVLLFRTGLPDTSILDDSPSASEQPALRADHHRTNDDASNAENPEVHRSLAIRAYFRRPRRESTRVASQHPARRLEGARPLAQRLHSPGFAGLPLPLAGQLPARRPGRPASGRPQGQGQTASSSAQGGAGEGVRPVGRRSGRHPHLAASVALCRPSARAQGAGHPPDALDSPAPLRRRPALRPPAACAQVRASPSALRRPSTAPHLASRRQGPRARPPHEREVARLSRHHRTRRHEPRRPGLHHRRKPGPPRSSPCLPARRQALGPTQPHLCRPRFHLRLRVLPPRDRTTRCAPHPRPSTKPGSQRQNRGLPSRSGRLVHRAPQAAASRRPPSPPTTPRWSPRSCLPRAPPPRPEDLPRQALAGQVSSRTVSAQRLDDAFREERVLKAHPKTGEVDFPGGTFLVPDAWRGHRLTFLVDPEPEVAPLLVEPGTGRHLPLERAAIAAADRQDVREPERWGEGPLQTLYDAWQGKVRPVAEPGFGLPEVFLLLAEAVGRPVPRSDSESALVQRLYQRIGPLPRKATETAFRAIRQELGRGRPIQAYLDALARRAQPPPVTPNKPSRRNRR